VEASMDANLTKKDNQDNMLLLILVCWWAMTQLALVFEDSDLFRILGVIATFITIFTFAWFKFILADEFVHSFWLEERMKRGFQCLYGYGVDEFFVLSRLQLLTGFLVLLFTILNSIDVVTGVFSPWSLVIESFISCLFIVRYCIQLGKYKSFFGFNKVLVPFVSSCTGLLITSMFSTLSIVFACLFLFFVFGFIVCTNEIMNIVKTVQWADYAVVCVDGQILDSKEQQFYLIFYSEQDVEIVLKDGKNFKYGKVDEIKNVERLPRLSDRLSGLKTKTPVWVRVIEKVMGLAVFR